MSGLGRGVGQGLEGGASGDHHGTGTTRMVLDGTRRHPVNCDNVSPS